MNLQNRENFLNRLAEKMGRPRRFEPALMAEPVNTYPTTRLTDLSQSELAEEFINSAKVMMVDVNVVKPSEVNDTLIELCHKYAGGEIVLNDDPRLTDLGVMDNIKKHFESYIWQAGSVQNIKKSEKANIGIVHAEYGLAETGGIVLFSSPEKGRSASLLPEKSIVIVRKSQVLPRVAQLGKILHDKAQQGERMPSCINIISGPSSTADIELIKVVGVHGPIAKIYLVIDDLETNTN